MLIKFILLKKYKVISSKVYLQLIIIFHHIKRRKKVKIWLVGIKLILTLIFRNKMIFKVRILNLMKKLYFRLGNMKFYQLV